MSDTYTHIHIHTWKESEKIKAGYKNGFTVESAFCSIMQTGSRWDINDKLSFAEWQAGLISCEQMQEQKEAWKNKDKGATE